MVEEKKEEKKEKEIKKSNSEEKTEEKKQETKESKETSNSEKEEAKKESSTADLKKENFSINKKTLQFAVFGMAVVIVILLGIMIAMPSNSDTPQEVSKTSEVAATVNGKVISVEELNKIYETLPPQQKLGLTKEKLLEQMIQGELLYQESQKQGIQIEREETERYLEELKATNGITEEQFTQFLAMQQTTKEEVLEEYGKQLSIQKFVNESIISKIIISDEEVENFYNENIEQFKKGEQVTVRHILIGDQELTVEEQKEKAQEILKDLTEDNFCDAVTEHSTDVASVSSCGEYTFSRDDPFVEEFKDLSFKQNPGDMGTADTQFGTHIIWTVEKTPARTIPLEEATEQIKQTLQAQQLQTEFTKYYDELRQNSNVEVKFQELTLEN